VEDLPAQFGRNLRELRDSTGLSQEGLASLAELDRTAISLLERGLRTPRLDTIVALAQALELDSFDRLLAQIL
jgi:transcriptional regulator with XRE-family HTH domain